MAIWLLCFTFLASCIAAQNSGDNSWQNYIVGSQKHEVFPAKIVSTTGNVSNPNGLLHGNGPTVLHRPTSADAPPQIVVDFGLNTVGFLQISFAHSSNNTPGIRLAFSETQQYLTNVSDFTRSDNGDTITPGSDQIAVAAEPYTWTDTNGCSDGTQVCADGLHGFRYLRIYLDALASDAPFTQPNGTVSISSISLNYTGLIAPYSGWFECSDTELTQYWFDGAYTNEMITDTFRATDVDPRNSASPTLIGKQVLFDGAKRDRDPYVGDIAVSALTDYYTHYLSAPPLNILSDLANHQRYDGWIPPASINDYSLPLFDYPYWWATASWEYVLYTGDTSYAQTYYPVLSKLLDTWSPSITNVSSGLLSKGLNNTAGYGDYAFLGRGAEVTYYNALYVLALQAGANLATIANQGSSAANWTARAQTVSKAINADLWDPSVGAYFDSSNQTTNRHAQDGNSLAVLSGVANSTRSASALSYWSKLALPYGNPFMDDDSLVSDGTDRVYAFLSYFEISARFASGNPSSALDEMSRLYGWMASHDPTHTFWEGISTNGSLYEGAYTSAAHGWSTGVVPALSQYVLGVMPTKPGYAEFSVKPYPGGLSWAKGQVPTPKGPIEVSWSVAGTKTTVNVTAPPGTSSDLFMPAGDGKSTVTLDGKHVKGKEVAGFIQLGRIGPGTHSAVLTAA